MAELEGQILGSLQHPNIIRLLGQGDTKEGLPFLFLEHLKGSSLGDAGLLASLNGSERVHLLEKTCEAIEALHSSGIAHRDIKPSNIFVETHTTPKLLDFGIARPLGWKPPPEDHIQARLMTPRFASPAQMAGEAASVHDDIYAMGQILESLLDSSNWGRNRTSNQLKQQLREIAKRSKESSNNRRFRSILELAESLHDARMRAQHGMDGFAQASSRIAMYPKSKRPHPETHLSLQAGIHG